MSCRRVVPVPLWRRGARIAALLAVAAGLVLVAGCEPVAPPPATTAPTPVATAAPLPTEVTTQPTDGPLPNDTPAAEDGWATYTNTTYGVTFRYPAAWQPVPGEDTSYQGEDGFFMLAAVGGEGLTIDQVADSDAHHKLQPYGSAPTIEILQAPGRSARLILPSADQPADMKGQAGLIVAPPQPVVIDGQTYDYIELWADQGHIRDLGASMTFTVAP